MSKLHKRGATRLHVFKVKDRIACKASTFRTVRLSRNFMQLMPKQDFCDAKIVLGQLQRKMTPRVLRNEVVRLLLGKYVREIKSQTEPSQLDENVHSLPTYGYFR